MLLHITPTLCIEKSYENSATIFQEIQDDFVDNEKGLKDKIEYVKSHYEQKIHSLDCLFYPAKNPKRLYVLFSGAHRNLYTMWSWFWKESEDWEDTAYLFLKDDTISWYLGTEEHSLVPLYKTVIDHFVHMCNVSYQQVFSIGHSMGGYAALYYGITLEFKGIFAFRPQIDWWNATQVLSDSIQFKEVWKDLDVLVAESEKVPCIYIQFGEFLADKYAGFEFLEALKHHFGIFIIHRTASTQHVDFHPKKEFIEQTLKYFEDF